MQLRDYQEEAVTNLRHSFQNGNDNVLFVLPTGGGKTFVFCYVSRNAVQLLNNVLILVHRRELLTQASASLKSLQIDHGCIAPKLPFQYKPVQVASTQTLVNRMHRMTWRPDLIIIDEAHHLTLDSTWGKIVNFYPHAKKLGVTATPCRLDGQGLGVHADGIFQDMVEGPTIAELIFKGHLTKPVVYAPPTQLDLSHVKTAMGDYAKGALADAMDKPMITGDAVKHYKKLCDGEPSIAFCASVKHAEHVAEQFRSFGYRAASLDGSMDGKLRKQLIADLGAGRLNVLTSCDIISEGTDIPIVSAAILLRPTQSESLYLQQVGRVLRKYEGKKRALILDHVGNCLRHGMPDDDREWSLDATKRSKKSKEDQEKASPIKQCEKCYTVHKPAPRCPQCGFLYQVQERQIEHVDGELQEVDPEEVKRKRIAEQKKAKTLEELEAIARQRGYKPGWAKYVYKSRRRSEGAAA